MQTWRSQISGARNQILGTLLIVFLAGMTHAVIMSGSLINPGTRVAVLLGGMIVTVALLLRELFNVWLLAYATIFLVAFGVFAAIF